VSARVAIVTPTVARIGGTEVYVERLLRVQAERGESTTVFTQETGPQSPGVVPCGKTLNEGVNPVRSLARAADVAVLADRLAGFDRVEFHRLAPPDLIGRLRGRVKTLVFCHTVELTCPALSRWLPRSGEICLRKPGPACLGVDAHEGCMSDAAGERFPVPQRLRAFTRGPVSRKLAESVSAMVFNSEANRDLFARTTGAAMRAWVLEPPIENRVAEAAPVPGRLVFVGRLERTKGILDAIRVAARLPECELHVYGNGAAEAEAREQAGRLGAPVVFHGWVGPDEVQRGLARASCVLFTSRWFEAWGMVGPEALAYGCPVVAYDVGGVREWAEPAGVRLVPAGDIEGAARAVREVLAAPPQPGNLSTLAAERWGPAAFARRYGEIVREVQVEPPKVVQVVRHPVPGLHSIEEQFRAVREATPPEARPAVAVCPYPSRGVIPRVLALHWVRRLPYPVVHITGDVHFLVGAVRRGRAVLTVHDCGVVYQRGGLRAWLLRQLWFRMPVARAAAVTVISEKSGRELEELTGARDWTVIANCVSHVFQPVEREPGVPARVLLVGTLPHKNLERTAAALAGLPVEVELIGAPDDAQRAALDAAGLTWRSCTGLSAAGMARAYANSDVLVFVSLYEGFGMPVLEAQATGRPVVTSAVAPLSEVAGAGAVTVDPHDTKAIREAVLAVLNDPALRARLIKAGLSNVERYRPEVAAAAYLTVYERVLDGRSRPARRRGGRAGPEIRPQA
jgi:glycosyltransferase involved in cell wall biosynthesis